MYLAATTRPHSPPPVGGDDHDDVCAAHHVRDGCDAVEAQEAE